MRGAAPGTPAELVIDGSTVATATSDAEMLATLTVPPGSAPAAQIDVRVAVDRCGDTRRVVISGGLLQSGAEGTCLREMIPGLFGMRRDTTFVVEVGGTEPALFLTQGRPPAWWLRPPPDGQPPQWGPFPVGLVLFGGGGLTMFSSLDTVACGDVTDCTLESSQLSYGVGAAFWLNEYLAAEVQYIAPETATASGTGDNFTFESSLKTRMLTVAGTVGGPVGRVRLYARAGMNRHGVTLLTTQSVAETTITVGEETVTARGGTQTLELRTEGWGYLFGAGGEVWLSRWVALYGDLNRAALGGRSVSVPANRFDGAAWLMQFGARVRIGR